MLTWFCLFAGICATFFTAEHSCGTDIFSRVPLIEDTDVEVHSFCSLGVECTSQISVLTPAISSCYVRFYQSVCESHLPCYGMLWQLIFFLSALKELLAVLGGKSHGLVILRELGVSMSVLSVPCANAMFKIWISRSCFYTRTSHLTLLKVSLRWGGNCLSLLCNSVWFSVSVILHVCHCVSSSPSARHIYYSFRCSLPSRGSPLHAEDSTEKWAVKRYMHSFCYQI